MLVQIGQGDKNFYEVKTSLNVGAQISIGQNLLPKKRCYIKMVYINVYYSTDLSKKKSFTFMYCVYENLAK